MAKQIEQDYLEKYPITIIDIDGELISLDRERYVNHTPAFFKLEEKISGILDGFVRDPNRSSGYDFATYIAASGYIIIWPVDINNTEREMISIPEVPTKEQIEQLKSMCFLFKDKEVYATFSKFKKRNTSRPQTVPLSSSGKYEDMLIALNEYFKIIEKIQDFGEEIAGDFRNTIRQK